MMRIKEAIQRKKLIHEMNEEWKDFDFDGVGNPAVLLAPSPDISSNYSKSEDESNEGRLQEFVQYLSGKLNDYQKRALKVTWCRLSEAPKTSGRGTIHIMEKVLNKLCETEPVVTSIFYKSAFLSCIEDRKSGKQDGASIATIRDHAHILVRFIDSILQCLFDGLPGPAGYDPHTIGCSHSRLAPLGFDRRMWHSLGECFAEVMFMQDCIRAYPHAASAWSLLAVAMTDRMYAAGKPHHQTALSKRKYILNRQLSMGAFRKPENETEETDSSDEGFVTAREHFDDVRQPICTLRKTAPVVGSDPVLSCPYSPSMRETAIEPPSAYCRRTHPIRIPKVKISRSQSEVRFAVPRATRTPKL